ncbi:MAG: pyruvate, phosphate dikinase [Proteobacteria bacterium]|nr:pyruvate, phosphate dikinase [Pseudomonadota bacterium]
MNKWIYDFNGSYRYDAAIDIKGDSKSTLGSKGAGLQQMIQLGIPVPPGFTIITEASADYFTNKQRIKEEIWNEIKNAITRLEAELNLRFGSNENPLLLSVRSGARFSMPGMMETILNLGLNDEVVAGFAKKTKNKKCAYDSYRRFISMYSKAVFGIDQSCFDAVYRKLQKEYRDEKLPEDAFPILIDKYKDIISRSTKQIVPQCVWRQLRCAIEAVFNSWYSSRAIKYRKIYNIDESLGTAVNIQAMVFGNYDNKSASGVAFTRSPVDGKRKLYGEFLPYAQGEDVVSGTHTPHQITKESSLEIGSKKDSMEEYMPDVYMQLQEIASKLEAYYCDMQDLEFTIQSGKLWLLQTRCGKRTAAAAVQIAYDLAKEKIISEKEACKRVEASKIEQLLHPTIKINNKSSSIIAKGLPASPGGAYGVIVFCPIRAEELSESESVILCRNETAPEDIGGMHAAAGILTTKGGMTSHAAVVARGMGKACVCGAEQITINYEDKTLVAGEYKLKEGDKIAINGSTGEVIIGSIQTKGPKISEAFNSLMQFADKYRKLKVLANCDTKEDLEIALSFGAEGIGLCRTEHMFFSNKTRINTMRSLILNQNSIDQKSTLRLIEDFQYEDFVKLFSISDNKTITIRLMDPPLHEFMPKKSDDIENLAKQLNIKSDILFAHIQKIQEVNPMLGHRGCRLAITFPAIYESQINAIFKAASHVIRNGIHVVPSIMVPFAFSKEELLIVKKMIMNIAKAAEHQAQFSIPYNFGAMIELPRAALIAKDIASVVDFCSFGTNDLTQTMLGISRDDASKFITQYQELNILHKDPFISLDKIGVGAIIESATYGMREVNKNIIIGVCGEHGGDPESIEFFNRINVDYVSCSPYRIPTARLAAAQSMIV